MDQREESEFCLEPKMRALTLEARDGSKDFEEKEGSERPVKHIRDLSPKKQKVGYALFINAIMQETRQAEGELDKIAQESKEVCKRQIDGFFSLFKALAEKKGHDQSNNWGFSDNSELRLRRKDQLQDDKEIINDITQLNIPVAMDQVRFHMMDQKFTHSGDFITYQEKYQKE